MNPQLHGFKIPETSLNNVLSFSPKQSINISVFKRAAHLLLIRGPKEGETLRLFAIAARAAALLQEVSHGLDTWHQLPKIASGLQKKNNF